METGRYLGFNNRGRDHGGYRNNCFLDSKAQKIQLLICAESTVTEHMSSESVKDYEIVKTTYGFSTSDVPEKIHMVAFRYSLGNETNQYGCKITIDEDNTCTTIDESKEIADFLLGTE